MTTLPATTDAPARFAAMPGSASFDLEPHVESGERRGLVGVGGVFQRVFRAAAILCRRASRSSSLSVFATPRAILPRADADLFIGGLLLFFELLALDLEARVEVAVVVLGVAVILAKAKGFFGDVHGIVVELVLGHFHGLSINRFTDAAKQNFKNLSGRVAA